MIARPLLRRTYFRALFTRLGALAVTFALIGGGVIERAQAQQLLDSYVAYIGDEDLYSSRGVRLQNAGQVLRQDRANYHRFGIRHVGDQYDSFFGDINNRGVFEAWLNQGDIAPHVARRVVGGYVSVLVEIYGYNNRAQYVTVRLLGQ